jgi:hypothetical protein
MTTAHNLSILDVLFAGCAFEAWGWETEPTPTTWHDRINIRCQDESELVSTLEDLRDGYWTTRDEKSSFRAACIVLGLEAERFGCELVVF